MERHEVSLVKRCNQNIPINIFAPSQNTGKWWGEEEKESVGEGQNVCVSVKEREKEMSL